MQRLATRDAPAVADLFATASYWRDLIALTWNITTVEVALAGWTTDHAAALGCATGALNLRSLGSDAGARDVDEAIALMRDVSRRDTPSVPGDPALGRLREFSGAG